MAKYRITAPDGHSYEVTAPDDATQDQVMQYAQQNYQPQPEAAPSKPQDGGTFDTAIDTAAGLGKGVGDVALGAQHYLGKAANMIGADTVGSWLVNDAAQGRKKLSGELAPHKARSPIAAPVGEISGNVLATLPVGGAIAGAVGKVAPGASALANSIRSGGFNTGTNLANAGFGAKAIDMGTRMLGGGITGGATAGLVDPSQAKTGAMIGAALPPSLKAAGMAGRAVKNGAGTIAKHTLGVTTGTGAESISGAYQAGKSGSQAFLDNMRGKVSFEDVVDEAKAGLQKMRVDRGNAYRGGMVDIANDKAVIPFKPIQDAMAKISQMGSYKGQQINKNAAGVVDDLTATIDNWANLNPAEYHTPEGLDALKQAIGDIRDSTQFGTAARRAADSVYNSVKNEITAQAPTYSKVMKDYSEASTLLKEVEKALSLGDKASKDTAVRKLQSLMRNNAATNYGNRLDLAKVLEQKGGKDLLPAIAGQSMSSAMPRGMVGALEKGGGALAAVTAPASIPGLLAAAPFTSPRLVGEALYGMGRMTGGAGNYANTAKQSASALAARNPGLLSAEEALLRSLPLLATSANR